jgi:hypothetical protein
MKRNLYRAVDSSVLSSLPSLAVGPLFIALADLKLSKQ